jgi:chemotaxis methyl-accepting protein methylase
MGAIAIISDLYKEKTGIEILGLQEEFISSQIRRRMFQKDIKDVEDYIQILDRDQDELDAFGDLIFINHTQFFRNPIIFEALYCSVFPHLIRNKYQSNEELRIWSSGCSTGEEPYSLAIVLHDLMQQLQLNVPLTIIATDVDSNALNKAKKGIYDPISLENTKLKYLEEYFTKKAVSYQISDTIKQMVEFENYDMINDETNSPPSSIFGGFDLIFLRNVLIYFNEDQQKKALRKTHHNLKKNGLLVLGNTENILNKPKLRFEKYNAITSIYRKI